MGGKFPVFSVNDGRVINEISNTQLNVSGNKLIHSKNLFCYTSILLPLSGELFERAKAKKSFSTKFFIMNLEAELAGLSIYTKGARSPINSLDIERLLSAYRSNTVKETNHLRTQPFHDSRLARFFRDQNSLSSFDTWPKTVKVRFLNQCWSWNEQHFVPPEEYPIRNFFDRSAQSLTVIFCLRASAITNYVDKVVDSSVRHEVSGWDIYLAYKGAISILFFEPFQTRILYQVLFRFHFCRLQGCHYIS